MPENAYVNMRRIERDEKGNGCGSGEKGIEISGNIQKETYNTRIPREMNHPRPFSATALIFTYILMLII